MSFKYHVTGMGAALVDIFANVSDAELAALGSPKASMSLIDAPRAADLATRITPHSRAPGGSAANTIAGIANIGQDADLSTAFIGKIGDDELGALFRDATRALDTYFDPPLLDAKAYPTGHCIALITPDAERTLHTLLGASVTTAPDDIDPHILGASQWFFAEGYVWDAPQARDAFRLAADLAHQGGGRVGLSLSDALCVARHAQDFLDLCDQKLDFLFANANEAKALFGGADINDNLAAAKARGLDMVITDGAKGARILWQGETTHSDAVAPTQLVDLTGAGDQFAAGFLAGCALGRAPQHCGAMGALAASEVIAHFGPRPETNLAGLFANAGL